MRINFSYFLSLSLFTLSLSKNPENPPKSHFISIFPNQSEKRASYTLEAIAEDRGSNPLSRTVEVQVEVVDRSNKPPVWDDLERISRAVYVKENTAVGETVTTVRARSIFLLKAKQSKLGNATKRGCFLTSSLAADDYDFSAEKK